MDINFNNNLINDKLFGQPKCSIYYAVNAVLFNSANVFKTWNFI